MAKSGFKPRASQPLLFPPHQATSCHSIHVPLSTLRCVHTYLFHLVHQPWVVWQVLSRFTGEGTKARDVSGLTRGVWWPGRLGQKQTPWAFLLPVLPTWVKD